MKEQQFIYFFKKQQFNIKKNKVRNEQSREIHTEKRQRISNMQIIGAPEKNLEENK